MYKNVRSRLRWFHGPGKILLLTIVLEALSKEIKSECPEELLYVDDSALVSETLEGLWLTLQVLEGALQSKGLWINVKKSKMMINSENAGKITKEGKFTFVVCREDASSYAILYKFCVCWVHKKCSWIKSKLKENTHVRYVQISKQTYHRIVQIS